VPSIKDARITQMKKLLAKFIRDDAGQDLIEYGLLIGIITVGAIAAITTIGPKVETYFSTLSGNLPDAPGGGGGAPAP
jgi:pilus assembly protein Flp/PilA